MGVNLFYGLRSTASSSKKEPFVSIFVFKFSVGVIQKHVGALARLLHHVYLPPALRSSFQIDEEPLRQIL